MKTGDWREAAALLAQLTKMRGADRDWAGLGVAREQLGEHWSARQAYHRSLWVNGENRTARLGLQRLAVPDESVAPKASKDYVKTSGYPGYVTHCWNCGEETDSTQAIRCDRCRLFICDACGQCRCRAPLGEGMIEAPDPASPWRRFIPSDEALSNLTEMTPGTAAWLLMSAATTLTIAD
jgi:hypothetical protein